MANEKRLIDGKCLSEIEFDLCTECSDDFSAFICNRERRTDE